MPKQQHFLDDHESTQVRYISLHSSSIRHILLDISGTLTPPSPRYPCAIHSTTDDTEATGKTPPPRRIGQDATARAGPGAGPPPARASEGGWPGVSWRQVKAAAAGRGLSGPGSQAGRAAVPVKLSSCQAESNLRVTVADSDRQSLTPC